MPETFPVALFAYNRVDCLKQTLGCLRENGVPRIHAFSDAPRNPAHAPGVRAVRELLRSVDWCEISITERRTNLGLGKSLVLGITETLDNHDTVLVFEDDHVIVPGAYAWLCAALEHYREASNVLSVTGWTHPRVTPKDVGEQPYLDGRAECWVWGTWRRAWQGVEATDAMTLLKECKAKGIWPRKYGDDLATMAAEEQSKNIWAVRWLYWHLIHSGLCVRPPHSMVEHIGVGADSTNVGADNGPWQNPPLKPCPPIPAVWPEPVEHPDCVKLWRKACKKSEDSPEVAPPLTKRVTRWFESLGLAGGRSAENAPPAPAADESDGPVCFSGNYKTWTAALSACGEGYAEASIVDRVRTAALKVKRGEARYERDGIVFHDDRLPWEVIAALLRTAAAHGGRLSVLDFGGSLGSYYFQCRSFLSCVKLQNWAVVEQTGFVEVGRKNFQDGILSFHPTLGEALAACAPNVILLGSVAQYLEKPHDLIREIAATKVPAVIVDRTLFWENPDREDQLTMQEVSPEIYPAKYPAWFFNERAFLDDFRNDYELIASFTSGEEWRVDGKKKGRCRGFLFEFRSATGSREHP